MSSSCSTISARLLAAVAAVFAVNAAAEKPAAVYAIPNIATPRSVDIRLDSLDTSARSARQIEAAGAAFIKVHFERFNLPSGVTLEVSNADGSEVYRYTSTARDGFTVDANAGDDGVSRFSAMSISGSVVQLRLVGKPLTPWSRDHGVVVGGYLEGHPEDLLPALQQDKLLSGPAPEAICGLNDKRGAVCYQTSDATAFDRSRPVARLVMSGGGSCTAWRVGADNRMFTNNHCFSTASAVAASEVWFNYQATTCGGTTSGTTVKVAGDALLRTDATLDYSLFTVKNFANISSFGYLGLDVRVPTTGEEIFIPQHAGGRIKELATVSDQNGGGRCKVDIAVTNGSGTNTDAGYKCDTEPGSSGSPVIARSSNKAIALHHLGGCNNKGAHVAKIWPQVATHFNNVIPDGDSGGGNQPPAANFSFTVNGLTAAFTDTSTDSDGSIASRSWNFGDSTTSTAANPSKTYSTAGTYTVTLTVTDNQGTTNATSRSVTVGSSPLVLQNGVPVSGLSAAANAEIQYTMVVPNGASNLVFQSSGGSGDADLYVKYGAAPTTTTYDCRPYLGGNNETCTITAPQAGTWYVKLRAYSAFSGVTLKGSYTIGGGTLFENTADYTIADNTTVESPITVSGISGNAPATLKVDVTILHTYQGDLKVDLVAPNGTVFNLWNRTGAGTDNIVRSFTVNAAAVAANGQWKLRVNDNGPGDVGRIDRWSLQF